MHRLKLFFHRNLIHVFFLSLILNRQYGTNIYVRLFFFCLTEWIVHNSQGNSFDHIPKVSHTLAIGDANGAAHRQKHGNYVNEIIITTYRTQCSDRINYLIIFREQLRYSRLSDQMIQTESTTIDTNNIQLSFFVFSFSLQYARFNVII